MGCLLDPLQGQHRLRPEVDKLCYLQEAIEDPSIDSTLFNGVKNEHHYSEVVRRLQEAAADLLGEAHQAGHADLP